MPKKVWDKDFYVVNRPHNWIIIPTIVFFYNRHTFLETGVYSPAWGITFRWLTFMVGFQMQRGYEI
jgi:hypothetical protein